MLGEMAPRTARADPPYDASRSVRRHVVVDGSNIATEGRESPSLAQLDEAVQAYMREYQPEIVTVVVDATFPNRIARSERQVYEAAAVAGEIITPPAGAIGRGDAFILQIADRAEATILSNDSFQEFHGLYDWLFEPGRLVGGKPVPHVGWVFMDRTPVRGPLSRRSVSAAKRAAEPVVAVPAEPAAPKSTRGGRSARSAGTTTAETPAKARRAAKAAKAVAAAAAAVSPDQPAAGAEAAAPAKATRRAKVAKAAKASPPAQAAKEGKAAKAVERQAPVPPAAAKGTPAAASTPSAPANPALPFIEFVGAHPLGSLVSGVVEQFSSHGAYVRVGPVQAYVPLKNLAQPAPRSAKKVLRQGESREFVVVALDPTRRGLDLALPGVDVSGASDAPAEPAPAKRATRATKAAAQAPAAGKAGKPTKAAKATKAAKVAKKAPAKKQAAAPKARATKAAAKKAAAKRSSASQR